MDPVLFKSKCRDIGPICAALGIDWSTSSHGVVGGVLIDGSIFDDAAPSEGSDEPGPTSAAELGMDWTDDDVVGDCAIETRDLYGGERGEWNGKRGFLGIQGRKLVDEFWINLADGIDVEETRVLKGLKDLAVDVVNVGDILLFVVVLR